MFVAILGLLYWAVAYWAAGEVLYKNKIIIGYKPGSLVFRKLIYGFAFGPLFIPIALIRRIFHI